jgi:two-component system cell cycle sensor histidine kinase/response regulator CckA
VAHTAQTPEIQIRKAGLATGRVFYLGLMAVALIVAAVFVTDPVAGLILMAGGLTLGFVGLAVMVRTYWKVRVQKTDIDTLAGIVGNDASPCFVTDLDDEIIYFNRAATDRFSAVTGRPLSYVLRYMVANPSAMLFRLQNKAQALGAAQENIVTRDGMLGLMVHQISGDRYLWRLDPEQTGQGRGDIGLPMLTVSKSGTVLFMNDILCRLLGGRVETLEAVFNDLPLVSGQEHRIAGKDGVIRALVAELEVASDRREIYLLPSVSDGQNCNGWQFFDELPIPMIKISTDAKVVQANRLARKLLNDPMSGATDLGDLVEGLGRSISDWIADAIAGRGLSRSEVLQARKTDKEVYLQVSLSRIEENGNPVLIAVLNDATELKTLEAQFVQSQKMQAIGQLAGGVAHDFNNLLTAISGHCDLLLLRHDQGDPDYGDLMQINQNANRAASLVGQLLAFSRKQNLQPEVLDLRDTLSDLTHLLNRLVGEKVMLSLSHDPGLRPIRADKRQLEQVLMNLVVNARDAMPEGGEIRIETEGVTLLHDLERDRARVIAGDYVVVKVSDVGIGISPDKIHKIFEPFYTTKRVGEGTGLGLSTVYGIVKQSGGFVFVDSIPGQGTCFSLYFPAYDKHELVGQNTSMQKAKPKTKQGEGIILLVEDEAPVRAFASRALRLRGYTVLEAENAEEALKTLEDEGLKIDVFVTDVIMPGMDGPSWVRKALEKRPDVKVVFVSGYAEEDVVDHQSKIPNSVFLPKPFSLGDLTATVQKQLH